MQKLIIKGSKKVGGEITVQGAKNSALALLAGCALAEGETVINNCPRLSDVFAACRILSGLGCKCIFKGNRVSVNAQQLNGWEISEQLMREMRSSIVFLGAVLGRTGRCRLSFPGGCELGPRPIDIHLSSLRQMGVEIKEEYGIIDCYCPRGLRGAKINLSFPSVGATENIMLAAVLAQGETVIYNAAREPEICDLAQFLNCCGGDISGCGSGIVTIRGVKKLKGCEYTVMPDRIVAATLLSCAAGAGGELVIKGARSADVQSVLPIFEQMGCRAGSAGDKIFISCKKPLKGVKTIRTMPYPGFPTDAQAVVMAALTKAEGTSIIVENIFENRYRHVDELVRMGANIKTEGKVALIEGVKNLYGANVVATDLRGGAALAAAAIGAQGETVITNVKLIDRGYESIENMLSSIGADIRRVNS